MMSISPNALATHDSYADTVLTLPKDFGSMAVAGACRVTALAFLEESDRWGKAELAMWLMGPYSQLTQLVSPHSRRGGGGAGSKDVPLLRDIDVRMVDRVIKTAREEIVSTLRDAAEPGGAAAFALAMQVNGFVVRCEDRGRVAGWVPTTLARRLADRVLSLFASDYLAGPTPYETELAVCYRCARVSFDATARERGTCDSHGSGMYRPHGRYSHMPSSLPEGA